MSVHINETLWISITFLYVSSFLSLVLKENTLHEYKSISSIRNNPCPDLKKTVITDMLFLCKWKYISASDKMHDGEGTADDHSLDEHWWIFHAVYFNQIKYDKIIVIH